MIQRPLKRQRIYQEDVNVPAARDASRARLKSCFEDVFTKYSRDFTGVGDEVDIETGEILVNNGHLDGLAQEFDSGSQVHRQGSGALHSETEWDSVSEEGNSQLFESETTPEVDLDERARQFGDNIATEILNIFSAHGITSNRNGRGTHQSKPVRSVSRPVTHETPPSSDVGSHERRLHTEDRDTEDASTHLQQPESLKKALTSNYSIWDPRPSPQPLSGGAGLGSPSDRRTIHYWTLEDLSKLVSLRARKFSFEEIADRIPDRTPKALQSQFKLVMNNSDKRAEVQAYAEGAGIRIETGNLPRPPESREVDFKWSLEAVALLIKLRQELGSDWNTIAKSFPGRSGNAVKCRYARLRPAEFVQAGFPDGPPAKSGANNNQAHSSAQQTPSRTAVTDTMPQRPTAVPASLGSDPQPELPRRTSPVTTASDRQSTSTLQRSSPGTGSNAKPGDLPQSRSKKPAVQVPSTACQAASPRITSARNVPQNAPSPLATPALLSSVQNMRNELSSASNTASPAPRRPPVPADSDDELA